MDAPLSHENSSPTTEINVLLMGETGVGKSTFINAFVNYLIFDTLEQAEKNEPIVLIPISFLITTGDQFNEFTVKFGDADANENHQDQGQSVTQHCKSYIFNLNDELCLRLVDTPGMSDTRGVDQDQKNIDHILTYVNNLSHLNAICLLFKPNASRLNVFFHSCVHQLLTYLTPVAYNNIIFCFTNSRSTFFAPGDTGPLLRRMIENDYPNEIPFGKKNTFCFDSESFRYLAARKCGVTFNDFLREEAIKSWTISVAQSVRLLQYIRKQEPYNLDECASVRKVWLEILMLARPLMETLRLIVYNWKLHKDGFTRHIMTIKTNSVPVQICTHCAERKIEKVGLFYITEYQPTKRKTAENCQCPFDESHFMIESTVKHELISQANDYSNDYSKEFLSDLLFKCDRLVYFLRQKEVLNGADPFELVLKRFLEEEKKMSEDSESKNCMNEEVQQSLVDIRRNRKQNEKLYDSNEKLSLRQLVEMINQLKSKTDVKKQVNSIKKTRRSKVAKSEHHVVLRQTISKIFFERLHSQ